MPDTIIAGLRPLVSLRLLRTFRVGLERRVDLIVDDPNGLKQVRKLDQLVEDTEVEITAIEKSLGSIGITRIVRSPFVWRWFIWWR